nr:unknown [Zea mays]
MRAPALAQLFASDSLKRRPKSSGSVVRRKLEKSPRRIGGTPGIQSMTVVSR